MENKNINPIDMLLSKLDKQQLDELIRKVNLPQS